LHWVLDDAGKLLPEVLPILDMVAEHDVVLSSGHLHISEIWPLFEEAQRRGVKRLLCNHPTFVVDATLPDITRLAGMGVYIEHSMCMFAENSKFRFYEPAKLKELIEAAGVDKTILGSDLGQLGNPRLVDGFQSVIEICLDLGYSEAQVRKMVSTNASQLVGI
jgi:predicted TIM-barrel fold metal-dependent hydrolase